MTQTQRGRFCGSCQKQIIDFSNKSDREIAMFFKKPSTGSVCGRFMVDQLNRDIDIPRKRIPWVKYFFQFLVPAFFISYRTAAQGKVTVISNQTSKPVKRLNAKQSKKLAPEICIRKLNTVTTSPYNGFEIAAKTPERRLDESLQALQGRVGMVATPDSDLINGKVIDERGESIPFATVAIKGTKIAVATDTAGRFTISPKSNWQAITLSVSCVGFAPLEKNINRTDPENELEIKLQQTGTLGDVVVASTVSYRMGSMRCVKFYKTYPAINDLVKFKRDFKIYPNPIRSNSTLTIEWKQNEFGDHLLQLFNQSGQLIFSKDISIDEKARSFTMKMPSTIAGNYFLKLTGKTTGKSYTEKLIVD